MTQSNNRPASVVVVATYAALELLCGDKAGLNWRQTVLGRCLTGLALEMAQLKANPSFASEQARVRAFVAAVMNLLQLAPDLQEQILFLPLTQHGRDCLHLCQLQLIAGISDWGQQRLLWRKLLGSLVTVSPGPGWQNGATVALTGKDDHAT